jgi:monothiol glutaredoxin
MAKTEETIQRQLRDNPILLYMKGTPETPQCGFSARAVSVLKSAAVPFATVDVLANPFIREKLPQISNWPTFPQLFVKGELIGGSDIVAEMAQLGELQPLLAAAIRGAAE